MICQLCRPMSDALLVSELSSQAPFIVLVLTMVFKGYVVLNAEDSPLYSPICISNNGVSEVVMKARD